jgi:hypothetical protein
MRRRAAVLLLSAGAFLGVPAPAYPAGTIEPVDVTSEGGPPVGESGRPVISGDGRWVAFSSGARLTPDDTSDAVDVYVRDLVEDRTTLVTTTAGTSPSRHRGRGCFRRTPTRKKTST